MDDLFPPLRTKLLDAIHQGPFARDRATIVTEIMIPPPGLPCGEPGSSITTVAKACVCEWDWCLLFPRFGSALKIEEAL